MAIGWMRLDVEFWHDEKFLALESSKGKAACFDAIRLYCLAHVKYGRIDLTDPITRAWVESELGMRGKRLDGFLAACAACRVIDPDEYLKGTVTSDRLTHEGIKKLQTEERRSCAAASRWQETIVENSVEN